MKILVHAHTTYSDDGELSVAELAALARSRDFEAVLVTDHYEHLSAESYTKLVRDCLRETTCLMVPGYERAWDDDYHLLAIGQTEWSEEPDLTAWADSVRARGGVVIQAHPSRYRFSIPERILAVCDGVEVWNSKRPYDGEQGPNPFAYPLLGRSRFPMCGQDFHGLRHLTDVAMQVDSGLGDSSEIVAAMRNRSFRMVNASRAYGPESSPENRAGLKIYHFGRRIAINHAIRAKKAARRLAGRGDGLRPVAERT